MSCKVPCLLPCFEIENYSTKLFYEFFECVQSTKLKFAAEYNPFVLCTKFDSLKLAFQTSQQHIEFRSGAWCMVTYFHFVLQLVTYIIPHGLNRGLGFYTLPTTTTTTRLMSKWQITYYAYI